jgi:hypothetical protein
MDEETMSDHRMISFDINFNFNSESTVLVNRFGSMTSRQNVNKANWVGFYKTIQKLLNHHQMKPKNCRTTEELDIMVTEITKALQISCDKHIPLKKFGLKQNPWWSKDLFITRKRVNALRRRFSRAKDPLLRNIRECEYKNYKKTYKDLLKTSK